MYDFQNFNFSKPPIFYLSTQERAMDSKNKIRYCSEIIMLPLPVILSIKHLLLYLLDSLHSSCVKQLHFSVQLAVIPTLPKCRPPRSSWSRGVCVCVVWGGGGGAYKEGHLGTDPRPEIQSKQSNWNWNPWLLYIFCTPYRTQKNEGSD